MANGGLRIATVISSLVIIPLKNLPKNAICMFNVFPLTKPVWKFPIFCMCYKIDNLGALWTREKLNLSLGDTSTAWNCTQVIWLGVELDRFHYT